MQFKTMAGMVRIFVATVCLAAALRAQRTWVVDWHNGPSTDFAAIQPAVDAAAPGDVILVRGAGVDITNPLDHGYPAPLIDGKGLTILGEGSASTWISGTFRIRNVPSNQQMVVARVRCGTDFEGDFFNPVTVEVTQCHGATCFHEVEMSAYGFRLFTDCDLICLRNCVLRPHSGLRPMRSNLMLDGISVAWMQLPSPSAIAPYGAPLDAIQSKVWIVNSYLWGQSDISSSTSLSYYRPAGYTEDSDIWIGPGTTIEGGLSWQGFQHAFWDRYVRRNDGTFAVQPSRFHREPSAQIIGTFPWSSYNPVYFERVVAVWATRVNNTLVVEQRCTQSRPTLLLLGPFQYQSIPGLLTPLGLDIAQSWQCIAVAPPTGSFSSSFAIPPGLPLGLQVGIQMGSLSTIGEVSLSNVTAFGIF